MEEKRKPPPKGWGLSTLGLEMYLRVLEIKGTSLENDQRIG